MVNQLANVPKDFLETIVKLKLKCQNLNVTQTLVKIAARVERTVLAMIVFVQLDLKALTVKSMNAKNVIHTPCVSAVIASVRLAILEMVTNVSKILKAIVTAVVLRRPAKTALAFVFFH